MKILRAKIEENRREQLSSEADTDRNTWPIKGKFYEEVSYSETGHLDFRALK